MRASAQVLTSVLEEHEGHVMHVCIGRRHTGARISTRGAQGSHVRRKGPFAATGRWHACVHQQVVGAHVLQHS